MDEVTESEVVDFVADEEEQDQEVTQIVDLEDV